MLESLPAQDILFPLILSRVSPSDLFSIRSCSRTLHHLVTVYVTINRSLDLGYQKRLTQAAFQILTEGATSLRHLNLAGLKFLTDDLLRPVLIQCPHLLSLELSECHHLTSGILQTLSSRSYQLERLILRDCHWVTRDAVEYHTFKQGLSKNDHHLRQLSSQCVRIGRHNMNQNQDFTPKSNLQEVIFTGCWELNDQVVINFLSKFPRLRLVKLGNIYSITDETMNGLARFCPHLHTLDIAGCWRVTDQGIGAVGEYCKKLSELSVTDCRDVTEQSLSRLRQRGVKIDRQLDPVLLRLLKIRNEHRHARMNV